VIGQMDPRIEAAWNALDQQVKVNAELTRERDELRELVRELLADDKPYPLTDVLTQLADAADHLLNDHSCDAHGYEGVGIVRNIAREMVGIVAKARALASPEAAGEGRKT
jgi:hypothetical protein